MLKNGQEWTLLAKVGQLKTGQSGKGLLQKSSVVPIRPFMVMYCKNIRRFYGKIAGNQLPVHFPLFLQAPVNIF